MLDVGCLKVHSWCPLGACGRLAFGLQSEVLSRKEDQNRLSGRYYPSSLAPNCNFENVPDQPPIAELPGPKGRFQGTAGVHPARQSWLVLLAAANAIEDGVFSPILSDASKVRYLTRIMVLISPE